MKIDNSFFLEEIRDGFTIKPMIKRLWAAELEVLCAIDDVCRKNDITYYAEWGTHLGAVRHSGFIPWDDDLDIGMTRSNFNRFISCCVKMLPPNYIFRSVQTDPSYNNLIARIYNCNSISTNPSHLEQFHGFPYIIGVDIFITDNVPNDMNERKEWRNLFLKAYQLYQHWEEESSIYFPTQQAKYDLCRELENFCGVSIIDSPDPKHNLLVLSDMISSMYQDEPTDGATLVTKFAHNIETVSSRSLFESLTTLPFEMITIPVVSDYHALAVRRFGNDYMTPKPFSSSHDYPYYKGQYYLLKDAYEKQGIPFPVEFIEDFD